MGRWSAVMLAAVLCCTAALACAVRAAAAPAAAIVQRGGYPVFEAGGTPFFVYGAAFFYERIPRPEWPADLVALRSLGINTLDLYVMWNWHEPADGQFDFDGHTNPRRDLRGLLVLARRLGFKVILRPGPVIRNEWRNGGYPAWLLSRPEYGMPQHDLLEGRYPPTATLQNANSDDAAAEWMANATHMTYASRWLALAIDEVRASRVDLIAVALDDDQGAYITNQTWPAPHLQAYLAALERIVRAHTDAPAFINTYEMKVTASAPVWAMGDWYQSDAYAIGEHDRSQLEFSTGLLQTKDSAPVMLSEFQAGWLEQPGEVFPRPADPSNTLLAFHTLLGLGLRGLVNFPAQDTLYPAGWEAPFANAFYAWDAALAPDRALQPRGVPTRRAGGIVRTFGPLLAATHVAADAAVAYTTSAYEPSRITPDALNAIVDATTQAQKACREAAIACDIVDLRYARLERLRRYPVLFVPQPAHGFETSAFVADAAHTLRAYGTAGGTVVAYDGALTRARIEEALALAHHRRFVDEMPGAILLASDDPRGGGFLVAENYTTVPLRVPRVRVHVGGRTVGVYGLEIGARDAVVVPVNVPLRRFAPRLFHAGDVIRYSTCAFAYTQVTSYAVTFRTDPATPACTMSFRVGYAARAVGVRRGVAAAITIAPNGAVSVVPAHYTPLRRMQPRAPDPSLLPVRTDVALPAALPTTPPGKAAAFAADAYRDGYSAVVLQNAHVRVVVAPEAGARAFVFEDLATGRSVFTTVGALRDDALLQPPPSTTDRIAQYTHQFPAGTFNRPYATEFLRGPPARVRFSYDAPDIVPGGAVFERTFTLAPNDSFFSVDERATFRGDTAGTQRAVSLSSLVVGDSRNTSAWTVLAPEPVRFVSGQTQRVATGNALALFDARSHDVAIVAWRSGDMESASVDDRADNAVVRLQFVPGRTSHVLFDYRQTLTLDDARKVLAQLEQRAQ